MNLHGVDVAHNEFEWPGWMLLSMNLHGADVALNEYAWRGCCSQFIIFCLHTTIVTLAHAQILLICNLKIFS